MEQKINIAELLKDCPKGMELDCTMYNKVTLSGVDDNEDSNFPIELLRSDGSKIILTEYGQYEYMDDAKCVIFPKGKTTWEGFVPPCEFKDGDIVATMNGTWIGITNGGLTNEIIPTYCVYHDKLEVYLDRKEEWFFDRLATEEEKAKLFQAIKDSGYKWNEETKTLEKLVEPKEDTDDKIVMSGIYFDRENYADEVELHLGNYEIEIRDGITYAVFKNQKTKTLENLPKFKVGDRVVKKDGISVPLSIRGIGGKYYYFNRENSIGILPIAKQDDYELDLDKFDMTTFKPFESKVLVRDNNLQKWSPAMWGYYDFDSQNYPYKLVGGAARYCIPYEGNKHLLGKTDDCDDFYKTW